MSQPWPICIPREQDNRRRPIRHVAKSHAFGIFFFLKGGLVLQFKLANRIGSIRHALWRGTIVRTHPLKKKRQWQFRGRKKIKRGGPLRVK